MRILKNPYILLGLLGIGYFWYKRKQILKTNPAAKKPVEEIKDAFVGESEPDMISVGKKFVEDVEGMDNKTLQRTIATNKRMLKRAKVSKEKRESIKNMLDYLKDEYDYRVSGK
tara:strand:+ start:1173 stop:1514 length:342 start_codon:yes stop_codon:yes gene_type:complete